MIHIPKIKNLIQRSLSNKIIAKKSVFFDAGDVLYFKPEKGKGLWGLLEQRGIDKSKYDQIMNGEAYVELKSHAYRGRMSRTDYFEQIVNLFGINDPVLIRDGVAAIDRESSVVAAFPGEVETLHKLKQLGFQLGIITNTAHTTQMKYDYLAKLGLPAEMWDGCISSCEVGYAKPDIEIYQLSLELLRSSPKNSLFVSHKQIELDGAQQAGMYTCSFNTLGKKLKADYHIENYEDLLELEFVKVGAQVEVQSKEKHQA